MTREEAIANIKHAVSWAKENDDRWCDSVEVGSLEMAIEALKQPEIIRCKDCQFYAISRQGKSWCKSSTRHIKPEDFCSRGWRREE